VRVPIDTVVPDGCERCDPVLERQATGRYAVTKPATCVLAQCEGVVTVRRRVRYSDWPECGGIPE